ncbi:MAG: hypothetical protein CO034_02445 [Parcubacteria group bacterium CG_4_9_14_0_2_um_filter_35_11]|nr:MAG: hypothetical protein CO034_02445 [Parcubacteria group bacterium CG_4_9_14_0_2_um_filter_35_11]
MFEYFISPTKGKMKFEKVVGDLIDFVLEQPEEVYRIIVGTDSEGKEVPDFVSAIVILRKGKGGRYFWKKIRDQKKYTLRTRIYEETMLSLKLAMKLRESIEKKLEKIRPKNYKNLEIHTDIGQVGETREMIKEIVGMVRGNGFEVKIKPEAFGASSVADYYLK